MNRDAILRAEHRPFEDGYGEYLVKYKPQPTPDGRYLAFAIVLYRFDTFQTLAAMTPDLPSFATQSEAANAGWVAGMQWVDALTSGEPGRTSARPAQAAAVATTLRGEP